jgi:4,5-DOPA dioxygenase extradiol
MKFPAIFLNHGGGPMPLLGLQPDIVELIQYVRTEILDRYPSQPKAIVVISAHYENETIQITSSDAPSIMFDYEGYPPEAYQYQYKAPGSPSLAQEIYKLLQKNNISCELNKDRGYDQGVFVPLLLLYPEANIPVISISLHHSMDSTIHVNLGKALESLREQDVLLLGSGYSFHNIEGFMKPTEELLDASIQFDKWLQNTVLHQKTSYDKMIQSLVRWETESKPYGRQCHPREEHLLPLFVAAAAGGPHATAKLIPHPTSSDEKDSSPHYAVSSFMFE